MNQKNEHNKEQSGIHVLIEGRVQGVGFRHFTRLNAHRLGVHGWVRNRDDGRVEIRAEGAKYRLEQFIKKVRKGPTHSWVQNVDIEWKPATGEFHSFYVRY